MRGWNFNRMVVRLIDSVEHYARPSLFAERPHRSMVALFDCERRACYGSSQFAGAIGGVQKAPPSVIVWLPPLSVAKTSNS